MNYPSDYDGPLGIAHCCVCGVELDMDEEAIQDDFRKEIYCQDCYINLEELDIDEEDEDI